MIKTVGGEVKEYNETLAFLQSMKEDALTTTVLLPLYKKLGYVDVTFHGGSYEDGKDLIACKYVEFDKLWVLAAQVKRLRSARSSARSRLWADIVRQLTASKEKLIPCKDGQRRRPSEVAFITPFVIDVRLLEEQFESVKLHNISIIDGAALYRQILRTWPSLMADIGNVGQKLNSTTKSAGP